MSNYGWICPKCGKVFSPTTVECCHCNNTIRKFNITPTILPIYHTRSGISYSLAPFNIYTYIYDYNDFERPAW